MSSDFKGICQITDAAYQASLGRMRKTIAEEAALPAYMIFNDRTLIEMAETRPANMDAMARIGGVGAKKLERYGAAFLEIITGEMAGDMHPKRRKLAARGAGEIYDRLLAVQADLARGTDGGDKPLSCSSSVLAKLAEIRPDNLNTITRMLGDRRAERFGEAFLEVLLEAS